MSGKYCKYVSVQPEYVIVPRWFACVLFTVTAVGSSTCIVTCRNSETFFITAAVELVLLSMQRMRVAEAKVQNPEKLKKCFLLLAVPSASKHLQSQVNCLAPIFFWLFLTGVIILLNSISAPMIFS